MKRRSFLVLPLMLAPALSWAHRFHAAITDVSFNPRSGAIEVVHTLMAHDLEQLIANLYQREPDWSDAEDETLLRRYLEPRFALLGKDGQPLALRWLGIKADIEAITVFQELPGTKLDQVAAVRQAMLTDFLGDQVNTVNISGRSLTFTRGTSEQPL